MATSKHPVPPREGDELDEETWRVLKDRDAVFEREKKASAPAGRTRETLAAIRRNVKRSAPR